MVKWIPINENLTPLGMFGWHRSPRFQHPHLVASPWLAGNADAAIIEHLYNIQAVGVTLIKAELVTPMHPNIMTREVETIILWSFYDTFWCNSRKQPGRCVVFEVNSISCPCQQVIISTLSNNSGRCQAMRRTLGWDDQDQRDTRLSVTRTCTTCTRNSQQALELRESRSSHTSWTIYYILIQII